MHQLHAPFAETGGEQGVIFGLFRIETDLAVTLRALPALERGQASPPSHLHLSLRVCLERDLPDLEHHPAHLDLVVRLESLPVPLGVSIGQHPPDTVLDEALFVAEVLLAEPFLEGYIEFWSSTGDYA